jgi:glycosyltransferase involved in cell wall biosynthesis
LSEISPEDQPRRRTLIVVKNISATLDQRVWSEATALQRGGYDVSVICPKRRSVEAAEEIVDDIRVFRHSLPLWAPVLLRKILELPLALFWEFILSIKISSRYGFDVIHIFNPPNVISVIGAIHKYLAGKSILFDYRDSNAQAFEAGASEHGSFIERLAFKFADLCLTVSDRLKKIAIARSGVEARKIIVLRPCPDLERVFPRRPDPLLLNSRAYLVAYAGEVGKAEGVDLLMGAINYIVHDQQRADIQFVIAGGGPEWHEIASLCGRLELSDCVTFTGSVDNEALCTILSTADLCVSPGRPTFAAEAAASQRIMEYMAIGKPIVQFESADGRALAGEASHYAKTNDATDFGNQIIELLDSPEKRKIMGEFGQRRVRQDLSWQREQRKLLLAYEALFTMRAQRSARPKETKQRKPPVSKQR